MLQLLADLVVNFHILPLADVRMGSPDEPIEGGGRRSRLSRQGTAMTAICVVTSAQSRQLDRRCPAGRQGAAQELTGGAQAGRGRAVQGRWRQPSGDHHHRGPRRPEGNIPEIYFRSLLPSSERNISRIDLGHPHTRGACVDRRASEWLGHYIWGRPHRTELPQPVSTSPTPWISPCEPCVFTAAEHHFSLVPPVGTASTVNEPPTSSAR